MVSVRFRNEVLEGDQLGRSVGRVISLKIVAAGLGMFGLLFPVAAGALSPPEAPAKVYFSNGGRIVSVNADGSDRTVLTRQGKVTWPGTLGQTGHFSPEISPDRSRMVYTFRNPDSPDYDDANRVMIASVDGSGAKRILADRPNLAGGRTPTWTPDGARLVVAREAQKRRISIPSVVSVLPDGSGMKTLFTLPKQVDKPPFDERLVVNRAEMSPDGSKLLVEVNNVYMDDDTHLEVVDLASGKRRSLGEQTRSGSWSADGASIIYVSSRGSKNEYCEELDDDCLKSGDIFVVDADGSDRRRVTTTAANEDSPSWSPDGERILYTSNSVMPRSKAATEVYSMKTDGTCRVALTNGAPGSFTPVWGGTGFGADPTCGQQPPPVLTEIRPTPDDSFRPVLWAGQNANGQLLSSASVVFGYGFHYGDCDLAVGPCGAPAWIASLPVCYWAGLLSGTVGQKGLRLQARRGGAVLSEPTGTQGLSVFAGSSMSFILSWGGRRVATNLKLADQLKVLTEADLPVGRLAAPRWPVLDVRILKKVERTVSLLGSVRAAALRLDLKPRWVRETLRFGKQIRSLGPIRTVRCPRG
jgi:Tol biopolymer transport system component